MKNDTYSHRVTLCDDGKYRWVYEMNLFTNPTFFLLVWKILFFIFIGIFTFVTVIDAINWGVHTLTGNLKFLLYFLIGMTVVSLLGYLIYAAIMGGKYIVEFEMDEKGINHSQVAWQAKKAKRLGNAVMAGGLASGHLTTVGAGMSAQRTQMYSDFSKTRKVKPFPKRNIIKVNEVLSHNQVYACKEDFDFVKNYIISHCSNLK